MATSRPRITVTLTDEVMDVLKRYSDASGDTVSSIVFQIFDNSKQVFEAGIQMVNTAKQMDMDARKALVQSLEPELAHVQKFSIDTLDRVRRTPQASPSVCAGESAGEGVAEVANPLAINKGVRSNKTHQISAKTHKTDKKKPTSVWLATSQGGK